MRCFISAAAGIDLSRIKKLLCDKGFEYVDISKIDLLGLRISESIFEQIAQSDLFLAIFQKPQKWGNTLFELGIATAKKKQIIILAPPDIILPSDLSGLLLLKADLDNMEPLEFAIDQILKAPLRKTKKRPPRKHLEPTKRHVLKSTDIIRELDHLGSNVTDYELEVFVLKLLNEIGISIVKHSKMRNYGADLAIWSDELASILGNPIIIEIKNFLKSSNQINKCINHLTEHLRKTNSRSALVLYLEGLPSKEIENITKVFNIFFFQIKELIQHLQNKSFEDIVRIRRNSVTHGWKE